MKYNLRHIIYMLLFSAFVITGCGPSEEEKKNNLLLERQKIPLEREEEAIITCNILYESSILGGAQRIKEINIAREKLNERKFLGRDEQIQEAFEYDLCFELVLNDDFQNKLELAKREKREEEERLAILEHNKKLEKIREEQRLVEEQMKEAELEKKRREIEKLERESKRKEAQDRWRQALLEEYQKLETDFKFLNAKFDDTWPYKIDDLRVFIRCDEQLLWTKGRLKITFSDNLALYKPDPFLNCPQSDGVNLRFTDKRLSYLIKKSFALKEIKEITFEILGLRGTNIFCKPINCSGLSPSNFGIDEQNPVLDDPILIPIYAQEEEIYKKNPLKDYLPKIPRIISNAGNYPGRTTILFNIDSQGKPSNLSPIETRCKDNNKLCEAIISISQKSILNSEYSYQRGDEKKTFYRTFTYTSN